MSNKSVIIVGAGLSGLVAAHEAVKGGKHVIILDQENRANLGGQAHWSLGGLFYVNSPEQKLMRVRDSEELAWRDWENSAEYDDAEHDKWPRAWGREYVRFAAQEKRRYLKDLGLNVIPIVGWAERGAGAASGHGNTVPRFHTTWGTGPEVVRVFREPVEEAEKRGQVEFRFRHQVDELIVEDSRVVGVRGSILAPDDSARGVASNREVIDSFEVRGQAVVMATGGIGGNLEKVRQLWCTQQHGECPPDMIRGVPAYVDGRGLEIAQAAGANLVNTDRMWHYPEGMCNWSPVWPNHGIRIIAGPSSLWLDATGKRFPSNIFPGSDNAAALEYMCQTGHGYSWFLLNQAIADKEFIFSGSEQNPDITDKSFQKLFRKFLPGTHASIQAFMERGEDWVVASDLPELLRGMDEVAGNDLLDHELVAQELADRDSQLINNYSKDIQVNYLHTARGFLGDKIVRTAAPHRILDPAKGPLIAVRMRLLTRKTLGGIETDLSGNCLHADGSIFPGLYACGEAAGFGGGGMHGKKALEGTFLGGCIHSGKRVGESLAALD